MQQNYYKNNKNNKNNKNIINNKYNIGEQVLYQYSAHNYLNAKIISVHNDDIEPYYTICFNTNNREKQTIASRLKKCSKFYV